MEIYHYYQTRIERFVILFVLAPQYVFRTSGKDAQTVIHLLLQQDCSHATVPIQVELEKSFKNCAMLCSYQGSPRQYLFSVAIDHYVSLYSEEFASIVKEQERIIKEAIATARQRMGRSQDQADPNQSY